MPKVEMPYSRIDNYEFPYYFSDNSAYIKQSGLKGLALLKFKLQVWLAYKEADRKLQQSIKKGICYYGPFKGEFGHFLAHTLPFLMYLHKHGIKIIYCGMELHKPLMVDEAGKSIVHEFVPLRDFFHEKPPNSNSVIPPEDVQKEIQLFEQKAKQSKLPFWNIGDDFYYWFVHRHWLEGHTHLYNLAKVYKTKEENAVCIFPRSKGAQATHNNGEQWDYQALINSIKPYYDKVYVVGHPSQSLGIEQSEKVELRITNDNAKILEACANSKLIITPHSGVNNLGEYVQKQVLIIYKGGTKVSDIGSMNNTLRFRKYMREQIPLTFAFSLEEIIECVKKQRVHFA